MRQLCFTVPGMPVPKARPRFLRIPRLTRSGRRITAYTPEDTKNHQALILHEFMVAGGIRDRVYGVPVCLGCTFVFPGDGAEHIRRPDVDNLIKCVMDALNGYAWSDDAAIAYIWASKLYGPIAETNVKITWFDEAAKGGKHG